MGDVKDGMSNTFFAGETLGECEPREKGWWRNNSINGGFLQTATPLNIYATCVSSVLEAENRLYIHAACAEFASSNSKSRNLFTGYKSWHPSGANFLMGDGSVQFINNDINYEIYKAYGGRNDGKSVKE